MMPTLSSPSSTSCTASAASKMPKTLLGHQHPALVEVAAEAVGEAEHDGVEDEHHRQQGEHHADGDDHQHEPARDRQ
jgi:hypothetical protein